MAENSRAATLQLVEGHCYALQVVPAQERLEIVEFCYDYKF